FSNQHSVPKPSAYFLRSKGTNKPQGPSAVRRRLRRNLDPSLVETALSFRMTTGGARIIAALYFKNQRAQDDSGLECVRASAAQKINRCYRGGIDGPELLLPLLLTAMPIPTPAPAAPRPISKLRSR